MKSTDVTPSVMKKVVAFERRRVGRWIIVSGIVVAVCAAIIAVSLVTTYSIASERKTWDVLALFLEDPEIIIEYGLDTLMVFMEELPRQPLLFFGAATVMLGAFWLVTKHTRQIMRRRMRELAKK